MATQSATAEFRESRGPSEARSASDSIDVGRKGSAARGIVIAILISAPFWALVAFTIYLVL